MGLFRILRIDRVEELDLVRFETRRKKENEVVHESKYQGIIDDKWVWSIEPLKVLNFEKIRISAIKDEINEVQIPTLEEGESQRFESVAGTYRRERIYRFGKLKYDRVVIEPFRYYTRKLL